VSKIERIDIQRIKGVKIGHEQDTFAGTGCTVLIAPNGAIGGVDVRGGAPATRETDLLHPINMVDTVHAVVLTGGSAFGLDAAGGVMRYLEQRQIGFDVGIHVVPIVCAASLFDLHVGDGRVRPDASMGYRACEAAFSETDLRQGNVGAGTGATVGKYMGPQRMMKAGVGHCALQVGSLLVGAVVAVNAMGDVLDEHTGRPLAGVLSEDGKRLCSTNELILQDIGNPKNVFAGNTTIGCVVTNAILSKPQATKLAQIAQNGYADVIRPVHTMNDGDTVFALALGEVGADPLACGVLARMAVACAVNNAVREAKSAYGLQSAADVSQGADAE